MVLKIDGTLYPDIDPPASLDTLGERIDFIARLCSAWDFGLLPEWETVVEVRRPAWRAAVDTCRLLTSHSYHLLRRWHGLPPFPSWEVSRLTFEKTRTWNSYNTPSQNPASLFDSCCFIGCFPAAQTDYRKLRRGYVHIPQQAAFFRADLWRKVGPLNPSFYFAMYYDLWVRIAALAPIQYTPRLWANFRLHTQGKTIAADERCWPEMLRVHYRDGGA